MKNKMIPVHEKKPCIGPQPIDTSIPKLEKFLKDEINGTKHCGCIDCDIRRQYLRALQYLINDYKNITKQ